MGKNTDTAETNGNLVVGPARYETAFLDGANALYIENQYARYRQDPASVDATWQQFFERLNDETNIVRASWARAWPQNGEGNDELTAAFDTNWQAVGVALAGKIAQHKQEKMGAQEKTPSPSPANIQGDIQGYIKGDIDSATLDSVRAVMMIRAYRVRGHLQADLDPLKLEPPTPHPELDPQNYGFSTADMERSIFIDNMLGLETATITQMLEILRRTYCGTFAIEFMHIANPAEKAWLQARMEGADKAITFTDEGKRAIFQKLLASEGLEKFLDVKYTGTKRFGLDGAESMVPALEQIIKRGGSLGVKEIVIGMPHRGRLNVLTNVMSKPFHALFHEFKGGSANPADVEGSGDVKYHLGTSSDREFDGNKVHLSLTPNPSHLEAVNPVVLGKARAKQDHYLGEDGLADRSSVIPLILHGDAAFAGQGIVAECLGLSGLKGHKAGGSIHFIVNNQIGFTTSPRLARSSPYPSDLAKMVEAPIFHVNGDDPEAVVHAAKIATEFRQEFLKPVVIDMFCYRRFGHNEGDEPAFTQPYMYAQIKKHAPVVKIYGDRLVKQGVMSQTEIDRATQDYRGFLDKEFEIANDYKPNKADWLDGRWAGLERKNMDELGGDKTGVSLARLRAIGASLTTVPSDFTLHRTLIRQNEAKRQMFASGENIDWATAEALAWGSLLWEGIPVRLSGQDSERGTFSQRHSVWTDQKTEQRYKPLNHLATEKDRKQSPARFEVINSMLSEAAVLGFEYGYSLAEPNTLVLWEAQFGDFANGAQVIIDQFISSAEAKWLRMSGLVMLLPHGYEGQGPEHSSARLERYLQLCAEDNMQVANVTTPANYFHILRRQIHRKFRKPLILMTPKSLLRHKKCVSALAEMAEESGFHRILWDDWDARLGDRLAPPKEIRRVILCTGKIYYDLLEARTEAKLDNVYIMRLEQLFPFPYNALEKELKPFAHAEIIWCQEEPKNMGAWGFIEPFIETVLATIGAKHKRPLYVGRKASASTATGLMARHLKERAALLDEALRGALGEALRGDLGEA